MYHNVIKWFAHNPVAANLLMLGIFISGVLAMTTRIPLEVFPPIRFDSIQVSTFYAGASPVDIEKSISIKIEEAINDLEGIKELTSTSYEGFSIVSASVANGYDKKILSEDIKLRVDAINNLPESAERPVVKEGEFLLEVMNVVIAGDMPRHELLPFTQQIREELIQLDGVSKVHYLDKPDQEITITISPDTLDQYAINMAFVAQAINNHTIEVTAGNIKTKSANILVRTNGTAYTKEDFAQIPIIVNNAGSVILLGDIATIADGFAELDLKTLFDGKPSMSLSVYRSGSESAVTSAKVVRDYIEEKRPNLPKSIELNYWRDSSVIVESRLKTLINSSIQGLLLVMIILSLFLRPAVAFWVCLGIPVCFMGAIAMMPFLGVTFNMISLFGFIIVLGIVVDDAIVTGESIFSHLQKGGDPLKATIEGTQEVAVPVTFGVLTTVAAFTPLLMVGGSSGEIFKNIPLITIPVLLFSLVESKLILPAHMRHVKVAKQNKLSNNSENISKFSRWQQSFSTGFENAILNVYQPLLNSCLRNKLITFTSTTVVLFVVFSLVLNGWLKFIFFPDVDDEAVIATITMPATAGFIETNDKVEYLVAKANELKEEYKNPETGESVIEYVISFTGVTMQGELKSNTGLVAFEVQAPEIRGDISINALANEWRDKVGTIPGVEKLSFQSKIADTGRPLAIRFNGNNEDSLKLISQKLKSFWANYPAVFDIQQNPSDGKEETRISIKDSAKTLGLTESDIAVQLRENIYGNTVQKFVRDKSEITVKLRTPKDFRQSKEDLLNIPIILADGTRIALNQVAELETTISASNLKRFERNRTIVISADLEKLDADIEAIKRETNEFLGELITPEMGITFEADGEAKDQAEAFGSLILGVLGVLLVIFALLAIPFKSYWQPLIVMSIIPLGFVGAIIGHWIMQTNLSLLSFMGMLALTGVVVNDSLVLVDYINKQRSKGVDLFNAVSSAGARRFRPVILTSLTTFAGLIPILLEKSTQAQFLKPMAISLGFGILFATLITLIIVPVNYMLFHGFIAKFKQLRKRLIEKLFYEKRV